MPHEFRGKIDRLLKAFASRRREQSGAPFDLHPATRKLLQTEVARLAPRLKEREAKASFIPRLIFAFATAASIAICAVILFRGGEAPAPASRPFVQAKAPVDTLNTVSLGSPVALELRDLAPVQPAPAVDESSLHATAILKAGGIVLDTDAKDATVNGGQFGLVTGGTSVSINAPASVSGAIAQNGDGRAPGEVMNSMNGATLSINETQGQLDNGTVMLQPAPGAAAPGDMAITNAASAAAPIPRESLGGDFAKDDSVEDAANKAEYIKDKLDRIIIPKLAFKDTSVADAIDFLHKQSVDLDTAETDPSQKGVNIVLKLASAADGVAEGEAVGGAGATRGAKGSDSLARADTPAEAKITLSLTNVSLSEALSYVTKLAGLKLQVDPGAVTIVPLSEATETLVTKEYTVPSGFFADVIAAAGDQNVEKELPGAGGFGGAGAASEPALPETHTAKPAKPTALDYLKNAGVPFPDGASANYLPSSNKLVVRNTEENLDLVDKVVDASIDSEREKVREAMVMEEKKIAAAKTMEAMANKMSGPEVVLATFRLELEGDIVRIVDADGSIYTGKIEQPVVQKMLAAASGRTFSNLLTNENAKKSDSNVTLQPQQQSNTQQLKSGMVTAGVSNSSANVTGSMVQTQLPRQNFAFRATGINRRLNKTVTFQGNYIAGDNGQVKQAENQAASQDNQYKEAPESQKAADKSDLPPDNNARIQGQAQIDDGPAFDIDAIVLPLKAKAGR